jgi:hypothetical protein
MDFKKEEVRLKMAIDEVSYQLADFLSENEEAVQQATESENSR